MKKREIWARRCLGELVKHVLTHEGVSLAPLSYQDLAERIGLRNKHGKVHCRIGKTLGIMGHLLKRVVVGSNTSVPELQALVVGKTTGVPDDGIKEFWKGYETLDNVQKKNMAKAEWLDIAAFGDLWNEVLEKLGEQKIELRVLPNFTRLEPRFGRGGESAAHKALKDYIVANPMLVGVVEAQPIPEYALPSLDRVDIMFQAPECWTAVEVKSHTSDGVEGDYERGVYQAVKYQAILSAMRADHSYKVPETIRTILVLENQLPKKLAGLATRLQVTVIDGIKPV